MSRQDINNQSTQFHIRILVDTQTEVIREGDPNNKWDGDDLSFTYSFRGYKLVQDKQFWDFILTCPPKGAPLFLVYALYDTGNSFHREEGRLCQIFLTADIEDATAVFNALEKDSKVNPNGYDPIVVNLPVAKRKEPICVSTWKGYFERLGGFYIQTLYQID
jgi:hypothetical protein